MAKVSIIIPAYNIQEYIKRSIVSCMMQTFKDIEIIVINDGSTDSTLNIVNELKNKDSRIIVIDKVNQGSMEARKSGWKRATGEYIMFVDGDDYISDKDAIKILYENAKKEDCDVVCYKFFVEYNDKKKVKVWNKDFIYNGKDTLLDLLFKGNINHNMWSKFIRKEFITENNIEFPSNFSFGEDLAFIYTLAIYNPKFIILNEYLYNYCKREGSLDSGINEKTCEITIALQFVKKQLQKNNLYYKYKEEFEYMAFMQAYYMRKDYIFSNNNEISKKLFSNWKSFDIDINQYNNKFYREMYKNDTKKILFIEEICKKNYFLGQLYYKMRHNNRK